MINKIIKYSFMLHHLTKETKNPPSTFNNIYKTLLIKKIEKIRSKLLTIIKKKEIKITNEIYKSTIKSTKFTFSTKSIKKEVRKVLKSTFTKKEKYGKQMNIDHLLLEYNIKKLSNDWNTVLFLIQVEDYIYNFIKKGGYVESIIINDDYYENKESVVYSEDSFFNFKNIKHPKKLKILNNINNNNINNINLENAFCLNCKKEISYKMIKYHLDSKIHKKYSFVLIFPNEEYFSYLSSLFSFFVKKQKIKKEYFYHCEICCINNHPIKCNNINNNINNNNNDIKCNIINNNINNGIISNNKCCIININKEEMHFKNDIHINNLIKLGISVKKGNNIFQIKNAYSFINEEIEEMEDEEGNLYDKKTYYDLLKMGLINPYY